jgi:hypothetical protein
MNELQRRVAATQATQKRFVGKPFDWRKPATCIHLMSFHAAQMGHKLPVVPRFRSALGARKALKKYGVDTLSELMDKYFPRIPASHMLTGDVAVFPGDGGFDSIMIYGQLRAFIGWHEDDAGCQIMRVTDEGYRLCAGAWRL